MKVKPKFKIFSEEQIVGRKERVIRIKLPEDHNYLSIWSEEDYYYYITISSETISLTKVEISFSLYLDIKSWISSL